MQRSAPDSVSGMLGPVAPEDRGKETVASLRERFGYILPDSMLEELSDQFQSAEMSPFGAIVTCSQFHADNGSAVLVGDAAHAITSNMGQGCDLAVRAHCIASRRLSNHAAAQGSSVCGLLPLRLYITAFLDVHTTSHCVIINEMFKCDLRLQLEGVSRLGGPLHENLHEEQMPLRAVPAAFTRRHRPAAHRRAQIELMANLSRNAIPKFEHIAWWQKLHAKVAMTSTMMWSMVALKVLPWVRQAPIFTAMLSPSVGYDGTLRMLVTARQLVCTQVQSLWRLQ